MIGIYKITNKLNGKSYIGQSIDIEMRFSQHKSALTNSEKSWYPQAREDSNSIEDFTFEIIEECECEILDEREEYWIDFYDSYENGYNMTSNGRAIFSSKNEALPAGQWIIYPKGEDKIRRLRTWLIRMGERKTSTIAALDFLNRKNIFFSPTAKQFYNIYHLSYVSYGEALNALIFYGILKPIENKEYPNNPTFVYHRDVILGTDEVFSPKNPEHMKKVREIKQSI